MKSTPYIEKLKDPRWQKKRLEILSRDEFTCQKCFNGSETLHVHHRYYRKGVDPWEYEEQALITLCATCHENETEEWQNLSPSLLEAFKKQFFAGDACWIASSIHHLQPYHTSHYMAAAIDYAIWQDMPHVIERYSEHLKEKALKNES